MNRYIYAECTQDFYPEIKTLTAQSYTKAVEKLIQKYSQQFDDDEIADLDTFDELQNKLNDKYTIAISNIEDIEEL